MKCVVGEKDKKEIQREHCWCKQENLCMNSFGVPLKSYVEQNSELG